ncbi:MAG TPA: aldo/keto reductase [Acidimicrobiales bacterium]|nr:aldo/keto reductase [Acidimicrobiales bacterium]
MQYRILGRTGIKVSVLCLGTMMFGAWGKTTLEECRRMLDAALDAGVNFVDTADVYAFGESEQILGEILGSRRDEVVLASKVNNAMGPGLNMSGNSRRWIVREVEASLRRLRTDHLDLYQLHRPDPETDISESLETLDDLVRQGKVLAVGTSTFPADLLVEAQWAAEKRQLVRPATEQPPYSIFARSIEADVLPACQRMQLGVMVWAPLNGGWLTGKYRRGAEPPPGSRAAREPDHIDYGKPVSERKLELAESLAKLAEQAGMSLSHMALAFTLNHPAVTASIIGPRTLDQLTSQIAAPDITLDPELLDAIDALVPPGHTINPADSGWRPPALDDASQRRRPGGSGMSAGV